MRKNVASQVIGCQMVSATDGSAFTGSVTVYVTGDAGTQAAGSVGAGACTHEGNGYHTYAPAQAETNYDLIAFTFTGTGAVPATVQVFTRYDANVTHIGGTSQTARDIGASVLLSSGTGTGQISLSSGAVLLQATQTGVTIPTVTTVTNMVTANVTQISGDSAAADNLEAAADGTGYNLGGGSVVAASVTGAVGSVTGAVGSVTGNVGGNVVGSVGSVTARVTANTDQLAGQTVTAAAGVTFPTSVASPTNITAGTITTATNVTTVNGLAANVITAASIAADAITDAKVASDVTIASVTGSVGSVTANVNAVLANTAHGGTSATLRLGGSTSTPALYVTNSGGDAAKFEATGGNGIGLHVDGDGSGAGLRATGGATGNGAHFSGGASGGNGLRVFGASAHALHCEVDANDLHGAYFQGQRDGHGICAVGGNGDGTGAGDGINATTSGVGVGVRAESLTVTGGLTAGTNSVPWNAAWDAEVQSECEDALTAFGASTLTAAAAADAVWDEALSGHLSAGSTGEAMNAAGSAGDPWTTTLPGSYTGSQAGKILADILVDTAEIGAAGAGLTALAPAATALSTATWTGTRAGYLDNLSGGAVALASGVNVTQWRGATPFALDGDGYVGVNVLSWSTNPAQADDGGYPLVTIRNVFDPNSGTSFAFNATGVVNLDRLDAAVSTRASQTSVDDLPTNAELAAALAAADDAVLTQVALVKAKTDGLPSDPADASDIAAAFGTVNATLATVAGYLDTEIAAIKAKTDQLTFTAANKVDATLQEAADIATAVCQKIAHILLRRTMANVEASSDGDTLDLSSLYGLIQMAQEASVSGSTLTVRQSDGVTALGTKTLTATAGADPITGVA